MTGRRLRRGLGRRAARAAEPGLDPTFGDEAVRQALGQAAAGDRTALRPALAGLRERFAAN
ncbi:hypothetical protein [Kitasatospora aureofaciens]|uniref:hypothetical protein n=1 Tax=Kitasatospora aureofaciens TaxID=1894 RepID=UPI0036F493BE